MLSRSSIELRLKNSFYRHPTVIVSDLQLLPTVWAANCVVVGDGGWKWWWGLRSLANCAAHVLVACARALRHQHMRS